MDPNYWQIGIVAVTALVIVRCVSSDKLMSLCYVFELKTPHAVCNDVVFCFVGSSFVASIVMDRS